MHSSNRRKERRKTVNKFHSSWAGLWPLASAWSLPGAVALGACRLPWFYRAAVAAGGWPWVCYTTGNKTHSENHSVFAPNYAVKGFPNQVLLKLLAKLPANG